MGSLWPLLAVYAFGAAVMTAAWWLQRRTRDAGYGDVVWAGAMGMSALFYGAVGGGAAVPRLLVAMMGGVWGFRLCLHLLARALHEAEDGRWRRLRARWNDDQAKFFLLFQAQALLVALCSLPFLVAANNMMRGFTGWSLAAVAVWVASVGGESLADHQLARWRHRPGNRGRACREGLWRYSRHPNYFFEWTHWFAYVLLSVGSERWWLSLAGPVLMGLSLRWVTGVPFAEAQALRSRGDDYRRYQCETHAFFPWFPKHNADRQS